MTVAVIESDQQVERQCQEKIDGKASLVAEQEENWLKTINEAHLKHYFIKNVEMVVR